MSRSYKKHPVVTDSKCRTTKASKKLANRRFRHSTIELYQGSSYKKYNESYNINDYKWWSTERDAIDWYINVCDNSYIRGKYKTLEDYLNYWAKCALRK